MNEPMLVAHAYGAPETIAIVVPLVLFWLILRAGRKREERETAVSDDERPPPDGPVSPS